MNDTEKRIIIANMRALLLLEPEHTLDLFKIVLNSLEDYKDESVKRNANIDLIVRNLKPEYLVELKKLVIPEVFESLGIET